jgi:hypothetical protein
VIPSNFFGLIGFERATPSHVIPPASGEIRQVITKSAPSAVRADQVLRRHRQIVDEQLVRVDSLARHVLASAPIPNPRLILPKNKPLCRKRELLPAISQEELHVFAGGLRLGGRLHRTSVGLERHRRAVDKFAALRAVGSSARNFTCKRSWAASTQCQLAAPDCFACALDLDLDVVA